MRMPFVLLVFLACALEICGAKEDSAHYGLKVSVVSSREDHELAQAAASWINRECHGAVVSTNLVKDAVRDAETGGSDYVVSITHAASPSNAVLGVSFTNNTATIYLRALQAGEGQSKAVLTTRVEKCSLYALSKMMGAKDCPFPKCVMLPSRTYKQLDFKARNHCPPCSAKFRDLLQAKRRAKSMK